MTILVEKEACKMEKLQDLFINIQDAGKITSGSVDNGADICCASDGMSEALGFYYTWMGARLGSRTVCMYSVPLME